MSLYDYKVNTIKGNEASLADYKGKVLLVVNTASKCGFTSQYTDLQKLYEQYKDQGLEVLGFPSNQFGGQEPGSNEEVSEFCQINYGVSFPLFEKIEVRDENKHPLFAYLTEQAGGNDIKWNFTKFLIDRDGQVVKRFESPIAPLEIEPEIQALL